MDVSFIHDGLQLGLSGLGAIALYIVSRFLKKHDALAEKVDVMDRKILFHEKNAVEAELKATKTYVDKAEFISTYTRLENKIDKVSDSLTDKIDSVAGNVQALVNKLLTSN